MALMLRSALRRAAEGLGPSPLHALLPRGAAEGPSPLRGLLPRAAAALRRVPEGPSPLIRGLQPRGAPPHGPSPRMLLSGGVLPRRAPPHAALRVFSTTNAGAVSASELEKAKEEKNRELLYLLFNINGSDTLDNKRKELSDLLLRINSSSTLADYELIEEKKEELLDLPRQHRQHIEANISLRYFSWVIERLARMHPVNIGLILMWPYILIAKLTFDILDYVF